MGGKEMPLSAVFVIIPAFGKVAITQAVVRSLLDVEQPPVVMVVDNAGDYEAVGAEVVERPGSNLGWLRGTNHGSRLAVARGASAVLWLNNDVALSPDFVLGLMAALAAGVGAVAPCYDDNFVVQRRGYTGPAHSYVSRDVDHLVSVADGTAVLVPVATLDAVGMLDEEMFGRFGWGAIEDFAHRVRQAGLTFVVTERAYLNHLSRVTANSVNANYASVATSEMWLGLKRKYGRRWPELFPDGSYALAESAPYLRARLRLRRATKTERLSTDAAR